MSDPSHLERDNDSHIRDLADKVDTLKSISLSIQGAVRDSSSILSGMGDQFDSATRIVRGTVGRVSALIHRKTGHPMWHFILFIIGAFLLMWFLFHK
jgi:blocked-early-in-transport protein 1